MNSDAIPIDIKLTGSSFKTNWSLLVLIFLMPFRNLQVQYLPNFGFGLSTINILFLLSIFHAIKYGVKPTDKIMINKFIVFYILSGILAYFVSFQLLGNDAVENWKSLKDGLIPLFVVFVVQRSAVDEIQWNRILLTTMLSIPYTFRLVYDQYLSVSKYHYSDSLRIRGPFMDLGANELGAYAVTASLVLLALLITTWHIKKMRYVLLVLSVGAIGSLLYSYSRGGYLAFIIGFLAVIFNYKKSFKILFPIVLISVIGLNFLPKSVEERFNSIEAPEEERDESAKSRFVFWKIAYENFKEQPILGYGYKTAADIRINPYQMDTHNYFVKVLEERGAVGITLLALLLVQLRNMIKVKLDWEKNTPIINGTVLGALGAFYALLVGNMFGDRFSHMAIITIFWVVIGLVSVVNSQIDEKEESHAIFKEDS